MNTMTGNARAAGALFLLSTVSYLIGSGLLTAILNRPEFPALPDSERMQALAGLFLEFVNAAAVIGIAIFLYPVLKKHRDSIAIGYLSSRIVEAVLLLASMIGPLALLGLGEEGIAGGDSSLRTIGNLAIEGKEMAFQLAMLVLGLGSLLMCFSFYRTKQIPRSLSLLGIIGYVALLASSCLKMAGADPGMLLFIPGGLFELALPIWLIVKGVDGSGRAPG